MKLQISELESGIRLITLIGKLDGPGVYAIEMDFRHHCMGDHKKVVVDLSQVSYISSIGIPLLVDAAKSMAARKGRMVLLGPQKNVYDVLEMVGVTRIIPTYFDMVMVKQFL